MIDCWLRPLTDLRTLPLKEVKRDKRMAMRETWKLITQMLKIKDHCLELQGSLAARPSPLWPVHPEPSQARQWG